MKEAHDFFTTELHQNNLPRSQPFILSLPLTPRPRPTPNSLPARLGEKEIPSSGVSEAEAAWEAQLAAYRPVAAPSPTARWNFQQGVVDANGALTGKLEGGAIVTAEVWCSMEKLLMSFRNH